jgi:hypothetical protein
VVGQGCGGGEGLVHFVYGAKGYAVELCREGFGAVAVDGD